MVSFDAFLRMNCKMIMPFFVVFMISCKIQQKVTTGRQAYELKQYATAVSLFKKELADESKQEAKAAIAYSLGDCFEKLLDYNQALDSYSKAETNSFGSSATLKKAYVLKKLMRYDEAINNFENIKNIAAVSEEARNQILVCRYLNSTRKHIDKDLSIEKYLDGAYSSDYGSVIYDDDFLVISSDREEATGSDKYAWTGHKFSDLFIVDKDNRNIKRFDAVINSEFNEGTPAFTKDYGTMAFVRCFAASDETNDLCKLMTSKRLNGVWTDPTVMPFVKSGINYSQPCFFENDSVLIFSAKGEAAAMGFDLWYAQWNGSNWDDPLPLPESINSTSNEHFPTADGDTLYFSSDVNTGYGGLDIYKTWLVNGVWQKPTHLKFPINSGGDDYGFVVDRFAYNTRNIRQQGFLTSSRNNLGRDEIFAYKYFSSIDGAGEQINVTKTDKNNDKERQIYLAVKVVGSKYENDNPNGSRIGKLPLNGADIVIMSGGDEIINQRTDKNGLLLTSLKENLNFSILVKKDSFLNQTIALSTQNLIFEEGQNSTTINREVVLEKIYKGREIILDNIYYDYEKWDIKDEAKPTLEKLALMMQNNPLLNIELGSHTDCRGDETYNIDLSQKRAQSAIDFLISKNVSRERLIAKGYGESIPAVNCDCQNCTEAQHQVNRRTSFKIL